MERNKDVPAIPKATQCFDQLPDFAGVDVKTVAALEGVAVATIWRWSGKGVIPKPEPKAPGTNTTRWNVGKLRRARAVRLEPA